MEKELVKKILANIEEDARISHASLALMLEKEEGEIAETIRKCEAEGVIMGYKTLIDWDKTDREYVSAIIELKVTPQKDRGFDEIAERISNFPEVRDMYLMSGTYDFALVIEGKTMKQVAYFVAEKLAPIDSVISTSTHFVLRKYKNNGVVFGKLATDERSNIS